MGLTIDKILVIMVIAMFILGPERLPLYAKKLGDLVRKVKSMADGAKGRLRDEMGPEFDEVDWKQLDPRQYDPRRIVRDALLEDERDAQAEKRRTRASQTTESRRIGGSPARSDLHADGTVNGDLDQAENGAEKKLFFDEEAT